MSVLVDNFGLIREGFLRTLELAVFSALGALVIGTLIAAMRVSPAPPLRAAGALYVETVRNTPLTVVFFMLVFGLPKIGLLFSLVLTAITALSLYTGAFVSEAIRSGINSVAGGQAEAARAVGLTFGQTLRLVILPQAFRTVVPPLGNLWIANAKNTAIASAFGVVELTSVSSRLINSEAQTIVILLGTAAAYLIITLPSGAFFNALERRVAIAR